MPVQIDEAWEYYEPDAEIAEMLRDSTARIVRAHKKPSQSPFFFQFLGNSDFEEGRFFDGLQFGVNKVKPWFAWTLEAGKKQLEKTGVLAAFEEQIGSVNRHDRADWLARSFCRTWDKLPPQILAVCEAAIAWTPPPDNAEHFGRPCGPFPSLAQRFGVDKATVRRRWDRARFAFIYELIPDEKKAKCGCGCGGNVAVSYTTHGIWNRKNGEPAAFITGHNAKVKDTLEPVGRPACQICRRRHMGVCPLARKAEFFDDGTIKSYELKTDTEVDAEQEQVRLAAERAKQEEQAAREAEKRAKLLTRLQAPDWKQLYCEAVLGGSGV